MKKLTFLFALLCVSVMGWAVQYCDFPTGHLNDANFGDANGRILLTLVPTGNANEYQLSIKPNSANGNTKKLDYLYAIIGDGGTTSPYPIEAGTDESSVEDELSATFTYTGGVNTMTIQWSYPEWTGRWQCTLENVDMSALEVCGGGGGEPTPDPDPEPVSYCDVPTGHESNPNFGDANGRILLSIEPTGNASEYKLTIKPNTANGNTKKLDYLYVIAGGNTPYPATSGTDDDGNAYDEMSVIFTNSNAKASFTIQWSYPDWGGRWQCAVNDVPLSNLAACSSGSADPDPDPTEIYDTNFALQSQGATATAQSGNDAALANNGNIGDRWWSETADMTDEQKNDQWWQVDLGRRRIFNTIQIVWEGAWGKSFDIQISNDAETWTTIKEIRNQNIPGPFPYEQTITLDANKTARYVRFQGVERGTPYAYSFWEFRVFLAGASTLTSINLTAAAAMAEVGSAGVALTAQPKDQNNANMEAEISWEITPAAAGHMSGNTFIPDQAGAANIVAYSGDVRSAAVTILAYTGANVALQKDVEASGYDNNTNLYPSFAVDDNEGSLWSARIGETGDERIYDAWIIVDLGAFYDINLIAIRWEGACSRHYHVDFSADKAAWRTAYNAGWEAIATHWEYLSGTETDATKVRYVRVWSTEAVSQYGVKIMDLKVFGTEWVDSGDTEAPVMVSASKESNTYTEAVIAVSATDNHEVARYHIVDATNGIDANYTATDGKITITGLNASTDYNFTVTAIDLAGNESANNIVVAVSIPFNSTENLALNKTSEAGYEDGNPAETAAKANDGDDNTAWVTYADRPASVEWWYVDLGKIYTLTNITVLSGEPYSTNFIVQARIEAPAAADKADDAAWVTLATVTDGAVNAEKSLDVSGVGRYVRFHSLAKSANFFRLREIRVYGSGVAEVDTEKPVMSSASLVSNTDSRAIISVSATDNQGIAKYRVVDATNGIDAYYAAEAGNITVTGLAGGTTYNFTITAIDFFGNESANSKSVEVTTVAHLTAPTAVAPAPTWPAEQVKALYSPTYEADYNHQDWGSGTTYTQEEYGKKYVTTPYDRGYFGADGFNLNCLQMEKLHYDIWIADDATIRIVPIWGGAEQGVTVNLIGQQWNSVDIPLSTYTGISDWSNIFQMKIDQAYDLTFWVGNAYFYRETAIVDNEAPVIVSASVTEESFNSVKISVNATDDSGVVNISVKNGDAEVATAAAASGVEKVITVNGLAAGTTYNLKVIASDEAGNETESSVLTARTKYMPAPAPTPDFTGMTVVPVFTDARAGGPETINLPNWGQASVSSFIDIASGDKVFFSQNFNYQGWDNFSIDATGMNYLHLDVYTNGMTSMNITPISPGHEGVSVHPLTANRWNSIDIPLTDYDGREIDWSNIFQFKFFEATPQGKEIFIDNVYFYYIPEITFVDNASNSELIANNAGKVVAAEINRDILANDEWFTLCVPFDMNATKINEVFGSSSITTLVGTEDRGAILHLNFDFVDAIEAGRPYLIKPSKDFHVGDIMRAVLVKNVDPIEVGDGNMKFVGTYSQITLSSQNQRFVGPENYLYSPADGGTEMGAFRCYFTIPAGSVLAQAPHKPARIVFGSQVATGIENVQGDNVQCTKVLRNGQLYLMYEGRMYNVQGQVVK